MPAGSIVNKWMLEFAICDVKDDRLIAQMLSVVPALKDDSGLKKILLLRAIESELAEYSVSEKMLDALEIAFEIDRKEGFEVLESMKKAHCFVAVDCVVRFVRSITEGDEYLYAVKRIWRKRIGRLCKFNVDLVSEDLEYWTDYIESAVWDNDLREKLFKRNTRYEALVAVKRYLVEAWKTVGPKFSSSLLDKSVVQAQLLCLQKIGEANKGIAVKTSKIPERSGDSSNPTTHGGGEVMNRPQDPSSHVSSLFKNKDQQHLANISTQNPDGNMHEEESHTIMNLNRGENVRLECTEIPEEKNLLQTPCGFTQCQVENIVVEEATLPLPATCYHNSIDHNDLAKGRGMDVVKEHVPDLPSTAPHTNLHHPNNLKPHHKVGMRRKHVAGPIRLSKRVRINDSEGMDPEGSNIQHNPLSEVEAIKIHEELKSSSRELNDLVKDPLLEALNVAEALLSNLSKNYVPRDNVASARNMEALKTCDVEVEKGNDEASTSNRNNVRTTSMNRNSMNLKTNQAHEMDPIGVPNNESSPVGKGNSNHNFLNEGSRHENHQRRTNMWERNASTRTYEWDDSADGCRQENFRLPTPKNSVISPLKKYEIQKLHRRKKKWSVSEEDTLRDGVQRYGKGNWKMILNAYRDVFEERTEVDLKDKWRNMTRY